MNQNQSSIKYPNRADMLALLKAREKGGVAARPEAPQCNSVPGGAGR